MDGKLGKGGTTKEDIEKLKAEFAELLGREVGLSTPRMFLPPVFEIYAEEFVHLDALLDRNADHLIEAGVDPIIIEKRLELIVIAKRYDLVNLRLVGDILRKSRRPDCGVRMWADYEGRRYLDDILIYGL